jgi:hypothetical protein
LCKHETAFRQTFHRRTCHTIRRDHHHLQLLLFLELQD